MKIRTLLNSSRQMIFENPVEGYEYSARGTVFLCWYGPNLYAVTAKHVIEGFEADAVRILIHPEDREFAPHSAQATLVPVDEDDPDYADLALFPVEHDMFDQERFKDWPPFVLEDSLVAGTPPSSDTLIFRGFPHDRSGVDFDSAKIRQQPVILEGDHIGPAPMMHCHEMKLRDVTVCSTLDGFSGSPVFWLGDTGPPREYRFAGVLIKGTHSSKTAYYVDAEVLRQALKRLNDDSA